MRLDAGALSQRYKYLTAFFGTLFYITIHSCLKRFTHSIKDDCHFMAHMSFVLVLKNFVLDLELEKIFISPAQRPAMYSILEGPAPLLWWMIGIWFLSWATLCTLNVSNLWMMIKSPSMTTSATIVGQQDPLSSKMRDFCSGIVNLLMFYSSFSKVNDNDTIVDGTSIVTRFRR